MEQIRQYFEHAIQQKIANEEWQFFVSKLSGHEFSKKHILIKAGQTEDYLSFVEKGIIRYYIPKIDNDLTISFVFDGHFASAYDYFLTRAPSVYEGRTLNKTTLWRIKYADLQDIYSQTEIGNKIGRFASENLFLKKFKRELSLLHESEQRYRNLFAEQAHLLTHIPLKYIASYLALHRRL